MNGIELFTIFFMLCGPVIVLIVIVAVLILSVSIRYVRKDTRIAHVRNLSNIKVIGPGWVVLNPFRGKIMVVSMQEQYCESAIDENVTERIQIVYKVGNIEEAVRTSLAHALFLLQRVDMPEHKKEKIRHSGDFGPIMKLITSFVTTMGFLIYKQVLSEHSQDSISSSLEIANKCKAEMEKTLTGRGVEIVTVGISSI